MTATSLLIKNTILCGIVLYIFLNRISQLWDSQPIQFDVVENIWIFLKNTYLWLLKSDSRSCLWTALTEQEDTKARILFAFIL